MAGHLDAPDTAYPLPHLEEIPDNDVDKPKEAYKLVLHLPELSILC
jgi:hypothetical protein